MAEDKKITLHIDTTEQHPDVPTDGPDMCPACNVEAESGFGLAGGGYGVYMYCPKCGQMLSKTQVHD